MDTLSYLKRIAYRGSTRPNIAVLRELHRQHLLSVPFENLDIHLGRQIRLDQGSFYTGIVTSRRGGYCYELNGCFAWLLRNLGFKVSILSAKVAGKNGGFTPDFDHMTLLVRLNERWLVDVGFGDLFTEPRQLDNPDPKEDIGTYYQIKKGNGTRLLSRWNHETNRWEPQYAFGLRPRRLVEFALRNDYQQTSPKSPFAQGRLISKLTQGGRLILADSRMIVTHGNKRFAYPVKNHEVFDRLLARHFHIRL